jgi:hypothetical protein
MTNQGMMLKVTGLWERTSANGNRYLSGRIAGAKVLILENRDRQSDQDPTHTLFFTEAGERPAGDGNGRRFQTSENVSGQPHHRPAQRRERPVDPARQEPLPDDPLPF